MCNLNPLPQGAASAAENPIESALPVFRALIHELAVCPMESASKPFLWRLVAQTAFCAAERRELLLFLSQEAEGAPEACRRDAYRTLRSLEEWNPTEKLPFAIAFVEAFEALPKGTGGEFHFLRLLTRIEPRFEGRLNIADVILGRIPAMKPEHRPLAFEAMQHLEAGDFEG